MPANPSIAAASSLSAVVELERHAWRARLIVGAVVGLVVGAVVGALAFGMLSSESTATAYVRITQPVDFAALAGGAEWLTPEAQDVTENYVSGEVAYLSGEGFAQAVGRKLARSSPASIVVSQAGGSSVVTISNSSRSADEARRTVQAAIDIYGQQLAQRVDQQMRAILPALDKWQLAGAADGQRMSELAALREAIVLQGAQASTVVVLQPPTVDDPGLQRWLVGALLGGVLGAALGVLFVMRRARRSGTPGLVPQLAEAVDTVLVPEVNVASGHEQAALARTLYTQCVAGQSNRAIVVVGASEDSGTSVVASMFEFAAAERGPVTRIGPADAAALASARPDADTTLIVDAGAVGASALPHQAVHLASAVVVVARIDHDTVADALTACAAAESGAAPVQAAFTYRPRWTSLRGRGESP